MEPTSFILAYGGRFFYLALLTYKDIKERAGFHNACRFVFGSESCGAGGLSLVFGCLLLYHTYEHSCARGLPALPRPPITRLAPSPLPLRGSTRRLRKRRGGGRLPAFCTLDAFHPADHPHKMRARVPILRSRAHPVPRKTALSKAEKCRK